MAKKAPTKADVVAEFKAIKNKSAKESSDFVIRIKELNAELSEIRSKAYIASEQARQLEEVNTDISSKYHELLAETEDSRVNDGDLQIRFEALRSRLKKYNDSNFWNKLILAFNQKRV